MGSREYFHKTSFEGRRAEVRVMALDTVRFGGALGRGNNENINCICLPCEVGSGTGKGRHFSRL